MEKKIHRFWAGRPMPEEYKIFGLEWQRLNPDYEVIDWDVNSVWFMIEEDKSEIAVGLRAVRDHLSMRDDNRKGVEYFVQLADVFGYYLVWKFGGAYFNCDMQPVQPLGELPDRAWASYENNEDGRIVNAAIGAPAPDDFFWRHLLVDLPRRYFENPLAEMVETTGPALLTDMANLLRLDIQVFPTETFNPVHWKQIQPGKDASWWADGTDWRGTGTIAVHHWGHKKDGRSNVIETATQ